MYFIQGLFYFINRKVNIIQANSRSIVFPIEQRCRIELSATTRHLIPVECHKIVLSNITYKQHMNLNTLKVISNKAKEITHSNI